MWALGCVLAFLYTGRHLFPLSHYQAVSVLCPTLIHNQVESCRCTTSAHTVCLCGLCVQIRFWVEVLGQPPDYLLQAGVYTKKFFKKDQAADGTKWTLMVMEHYFFRGESASLLLLWFFKNIFLIAYLQTLEEFHEFNDIPAEMQQHEYDELPSSLDELFHVGVGEVA